jgi:hypothetical protein
MDCGNNLVGADVKPAPTFGLKINIYELAKERLFSNKNREQLIETIMGLELT